MKFIKTLYNLFTGVRIQDKDGMEGKSHIMVVDDIDIGWYIFAIALIAALIVRAL